MALVRFSRGSQVWWLGVYSNQSTKKYNLLCTTLKSKKVFLLFSSTSLLSSSTSQIYVDHHLSSILTTYIWTMLAIISCIYYWYNLLLQALFIECCVIALCHFYLPHTIFLSSIKLKSMRRLRILPKMVDEIAPLWDFEHVGKKANTLFCDLVQCF